MSNATTPTTSAATKRTADVWSYFTDEEKPQTLKEALCRHCNAVYKHHKKSKYAITHLKSCLAFDAYLTE